MIGTFSVTICRWQQGGYGQILRHDHHRQMWMGGAGPGLGWLNVSDGGGRRAICARKPMVLLERFILLWGLVRATEPVPLVKVMFLLAFILLSFCLLKCILS